MMISGRSETVLHRWMNILGGYGFMNIQMDIFKAMGELMWIYLRHGLNHKWSC